MNYHIALIMLVFCLGCIAVGTAHNDFSFSSPQEQRYGPDYLDLYYQGYYCPPYWSYPYVPAKAAVQATRERLWANKFVNPNSVHWRVQQSKERLWAVKNPCYGCYNDCGWRKTSSPWDDRC